MNASAPMLDPKSPEFKQELRQRLTPVQYHVTQEKGTERAFTNKYYKLKEDGMYSCIVCGEDLFVSTTKYDSGSGWPAFYDVIDPSRIKLTRDASHGLVRTEVSCSKCGAHLGHLFTDGPKPTGKRYCVNSSSLQFRPAAPGEVYVKDVQSEEDFSNNASYNFAAGCGGGCGPLRRPENQLPATTKVNGTV